MPHNYTVICSSLSHTADILIQIFSAPVYNSKDITVIMVALNDTFASVAEACEAINHLMASPIGSIRQIPNIIFFNAKTRTVPLPSLLHSPKKQV